MWITINTLDLQHPRSVAEGEAVGYWGEFDSELGGGKALIVLNTAPQENTGRQVFAQVSQTSSSDFQHLPCGKHDPRLEALECQGDYRVTGQVVGVLWADEDPQNALVEIIAGPCRFSVPLAEIGSADLDFGQALSFIAHQLTFWVMLE